MVLRFLCFGLRKELVLKQSLVHRGVVEIFFFFFFFSALALGNAGVVDLMSIYRSYAGAGEHFLGHLVVDWYVLCAIWNKQSKTARESKETDLGVCGF